MKLTAHQPTYFPYLGTFSKIAAVDKFCLFDGVPFSRHDYTNRVQIKTYEGVQWLTVPVEHTGERMLLKDVRIDNSQPWKRKHLRAIQTAYARAPYFKQYFPIFETMLQQPHEFLRDLCEVTMLGCLFLLLLGRPWARASNHDFTGEKSSLVLDMCEKLGASQYIFGANGRDYADIEAFGKAGILVQFQDYQHPVYPQLHGEFVKGLSVIDALMNVGPDAAKLL